MKIRIEGLSASAFETMVQDDIEMSDIVMVMAQRLGVRKSKPEETYYIIIPDVSAIYSACSGSIIHISLPNKDWLSLHKTDYERLEIV